MKRMKVKRKKWMRAVSVLICVAMLLSTGLGAVFAEEMTPPPGDAEITERLHEPEITPELDPVTKPEAAPAAEPAAEPLMEAPTLEGPPITIQNVYPNPIVFGEEDLFIEVAFGLSIESDMLQIMMFHEESWEMRNFPFQLDNIEPGNITNFVIDPIREGLQAGNYRIEARLDSCPDYVAEGWVEIQESGPFLDVPTFEYVELLPQNLMAGASNSVNVSFNAIFENHEIAMMAAARGCRMALYKGDVGQGTEVGSISCTLNSSPGSSCSSYYNSLNGVTTAGPYYIELHFNYGEDNEFADQNRQLLKAFEVAAATPMTSIFSVHTEQGLMESTTIGNADVFDLRLEGWDRALSFNFYLNLIPADRVIGAPGWQDDYYRLLSYDTANTKRVGSQVYVAGVDMSYVDTANPQAPYPITPGEYVAYALIDGKVLLSTPFTVVEGHAEAQPALEGIEIKAKPFKTSYVEGEALDLTGLEVTAQYDITQGKIITDYSADPANGAALTTEDAMITVSYTEGGVTVTNSFPITVYTQGGWTEHNVTQEDAFYYSLVIPAGSGNHILKGNGEEIGGYVLVEAGYEGVIRLESVHLAYQDLYDYLSPFLIEEGAKVTLDLVGENQLRGAGGRAGLEIRSGAELSITSSAKGSLTAIGGNYGAGIGGGSGTVFAGGSIFIYGNAIVSASGYKGAGIGGASGAGTSPAVIISGDAVVNAYGYFSAGIGGGEDASGGTIIMKGNAQVNANSEGGPGIGGGYGVHTGGDGGNITIGGNAVVTAKSEGGTAIGGGRGGQNGHGGSAGLIIIEDDAKVSAITSGPNSAGIGGGPNHIYSGYGGGNMGGDIRIRGGVVDAKGVVAIGGNVSGSVNIVGGSIFAASGRIVSPVNAGNRDLLPVQLKVQDQEGNLLDGVRLNIGGYEAVTGYNAVWDGSAFGEGTQRGIAHVWLPVGEYAIAADQGETCTPTDFTVTKTGENVFSFVLDREIVTPVVLTELALSGTYKTEYSKGDKLDLTGLAVTAHYSDGSAKLVSDYVVTPAVGTVLDLTDKTVTVSYEGLNTSFGIAVKDIAKTAVSISVAATPKKVSYAKNETITLSGLKVTVRYSDGSREQLDASAYTSNPQEGAKLTGMGTTTVKLSHVTAGGETLSTSFDVYVVSSSTRVAKAVNTAVVVVKGILSWLFG